MQTKTKRNLALAIFAIGGISAMVGYNTEMDNKAPESNILDKQVQNVMALNKKQKKACRYVSSWAGTADNLMRHQTSVAQTRYHLAENIPSNLANMAVNLAVKMQHRGYMGGDLELAANNYCTDVMEEGEQLDSSAK